MMNKIEEEEEAGKRRAFIIMGNRINDPDENVQSSQMVQGFPEHNLIRDWTLPFSHCDHVVLVIRRQAYK